MINKYDTGNIIDLLGTINIDLENLNSMVRLMRCNLSNADRIDISDDEGSIIAYKDDVINYIEVLQSNIATMMSNIKEIQEIKDIQSIRYKGGK